MLNIGFSYGELWSDLSAPSDPIAARDSYLRIPWQPCLAENLPYPQVRHLAHGLQVEPLQLAGEFKRAEETLKSLLIVPLLGEREGKGKRALSRESVKVLEGCPALMKIPAVSNFVQAAAQELASHPAAMSIPYTDANVYRFLVLRQRLEDALVDLGLIQRLYNVRPKYNFAADECFESSYFSLGDTLTFDFGGDNKMECDVVSGGSFATAEDCMLFSVRLNLSTLAPIAGYNTDCIPQLVTLGRFDPESSGIKPFTPFAHAINSALLKFVDNLHPKAPFFFITWIHENIDGHATLELLVLPPAAINIFPKDPSELAILRMTQRRESEIATFLKERGAEIIIDENPVQVRRLEGMETGLKFIVERIAEEPYFVKQYVYDGGSHPPTALSLQEWLQTLEGQALNY